MWKKQSQSTSWPFNLFCFFFFSSTDLNELFVHQWSKDARPLRDSLKANLTSFLANLEMWWKILAYHRYISISVVMLWIMAFMKLFLKNTRQKTMLGVILQVFNFEWSLLFHFIVHHCKKWVYSCHYINIGTFYPLIFISAPKMHIDQAQNVRNVTWVVE